MLTNLSWLDGGQPFPPRTEKKRIEGYRLNERLFLSEHSEAMRDMFDAMARRTRKKHIDVGTVINYQQLLSKKTADFVCGEPPEIETEDDTDELGKMLDRCGWRVRLYEAFIDVSRYGNAVLKLVGNTLTAVSPACWFPIVDSTDLKTVIQHVIAYPMAPDAQGRFTELYVELHDVGRIESRIYEYDGAANIIRSLKRESSADTGLDDFAVQILTNVTHSGSIYGVDDYSAVNSIIAALMWRLHCIDVVLDKHTEPSVSGPSTALTYDEHFKTYFLDLGNYFRRDTVDDPDVKYITWDGNLDAAYKEIELLQNQLYTISEMGQAFMEGGGGGEASSGTALKLRMVSPRIKAARLTGINEAAVKRVIILLALRAGISLNADTLTLHWNDGLPDDVVEQVNMLTTATGGSAIMSQYAAMKRLGLSDAETESELEELRKQEAASAPVMLGMVKDNADNGQ